MGARRRASVRGRPAGKQNDSRMLATPRAPTFFAMLGNFARDYSSARHPLRWIPHRHASLILRACGDG